MFIFQGFYFIFKFSSVSSGLFQDSNFEEAMIEIRRAVILVHRVIKKVIDHSLAHQHGPEGKMTDEMLEAIKSEYGGKLPTAEDFSEEHRLVMLRQSRGGLSMVGYVDALTVKMEEVK